MFIYCGIYFFLDINLVGKGFIYTYSTFPGRLNHSIHPSPIHCIHSFDSHSASLTNFSGQKGA